MAHEFSGSAVIDRPINEVFGFLADGTNDRSSAPESRRSARRPTGRSASARCSTARSRTQA